MRYKAYAIAAAAGLFATQAPAQDTSVIGTWRLLAITDATSGVDDKTWGASPKGMLILDKTGHFSQHQLRSDRPKFAGPGRLSGTPEDHKRTAEQTLSYFGEYAVDLDKRVITFRYEGSSWPNLEGTEAKREFALAGDELSTFNPAAAGGGAIKLTWRRVK